MFKLWVVPVLWPWVSPDVYECSYAVHKMAVLPCRGLLCLRLPVTAHGHKHQNNEHQSVLLTNSVHQRK